jgi:peptide/nickel transport system substrate-binding protein
MGNKSVSIQRGFPHLLIFVTLFFSFLIVYPPESIAQTEGRNLLYGTWQLPDTLDVQESGKQIVFAIAWSYLDPLVRFRPDESKYYPGLAAGWDISPDAKEYTFRLRKDVEFHDGTLLTADAVKFSLDRIMDRRMKSGFARLAMGPYERCEVIDEHTVKIYFTEPYGSFIRMASTVYVPIISPAAVKRYGDDYHLHVVGTGPFMLDGYKPMERVALVRNKDYRWGPRWSHGGPAYLDRVTYRFIPEDITRVGSLRTGETNLIDGIKSDQIYRVIRDKNLGIEIKGVKGMPWIMVLNSQNFPTDDMLVRQAISYAIDRESLVNLLYRGTAKPAFSPLEKGTLGYHDSVDKLSVYNPQKAKNLLEQAGWKKSTDGIRMKDNRRLVVEALLLHEQKGLSNVIKSQLKEVGMECVVKTANGEVTNSIWNTGEFDAVITSFSWPDPQLLENWFSFDWNGRPNWANYANPKLGDLLLEAETTSNSESRAEIYERVQDALLIDAVCIPLFSKSVVYGRRNEIKGITYSITGYPIFYETYFADQR